MPTHCCDFYGFVMLFEIRECVSSNFVLSSQVVLDILGLLKFFSLKNVSGLLIEVALNL